MKTVKNACGACGQFYPIKEADTDGFHSSDFCSAFSDEIIKATCLSCGKETTNPDALQIMNDSDSVCLNCDEWFVKWETKKTTIITAEIQDFEGNSHYFREELN